MQTTAIRANTAASARNVSHCSTLGPVSAQYIFTTYKLSRRYPPDREVLSDISLSFLPGAKIGVLGYNGAGKSTLLRIMAGLDTEFDGQAQLAPGASVGCSSRSRSSTEKDVRGNVEEGVAETERCSTGSTSCR